MKKETLSPFGESVFALEYPAEKVYNPFVFAAPGLPAARKKKETWI